VRAPRTERYGLESTSPRGPGASEALIGPELAISLDDVTILDWIQAIQIFAKQAIITVLHAESESRIWCSQGAVIDASSGRLRGEAAFYRIASIERGRVLTELRPVHRERTIRTSPTWLLLEAARRKDERAQLERKLGGLDRFFHCPEDGVLSRSLNTAQTALLRLFDRPRRLADVVIQSEIGDIETLAALDGLVRSGQLVEAAASSDEPDTGLSVRGEPAHGADSTAAPIASAWPQTSTPSSRSSRWAQRGSELERRSRRCPQPRLRPRIRSRFAPIPSRPSCGWMASLRGAERGRRRCLEMDPHTSCSCLPMASHRCGSSSSTRLRRSRSSSSRSLPS
jgi:hypothetical protein